MHEYEGPIEKGMRFLWEPMKPHATEHLIVIERRINEDDEMWITTRAWVATSKVDGGYTGQTCWNDESRFREAVIPVITPPEEYPDIEDVLDDVFEKTVQSFRKLEAFIKGE